MRFIITKKNKAKTTNAPIYQNEGDVVNGDNLTINGGSSEYAAKLRRYEALRDKKRYAWMLWNYDKDQKELEALDKWLQEHAGD